jgi:type I restriction enzyme S subunit
MENQKHIPSLRFPEFNENWEIKSLGSILSNIVRPVPKPTSNYTSIGIRSHFKGTFQRTDSDPSKIDMDTLFVVMENDLIVNITFAWEGAVAIATKSDEKGLVSHRFPTYINDKNQLLIDFFRYIYPTKEFKSKLELISPGGAGRNRVLKKGDFLKLFFYIPSLPEQQKIASFLIQVDTKLTQLKQKKSLLEQYKKGVMQKIFSQAIRFKDEDGNEFPKWEKKKLGVVCDVRDGTHDSPKYVDDGFPFITSKNLLKDGTIDFVNVSFITEDVYNKVNQRSKVNINDILFGMIGTIGNPVLVKSDGFAIKNVALIKEKKEMKNFFLIHFLKGDAINQQFFEQNTGGTQKFLSLSIVRDLMIEVPCIDEQIKIANFLSALDEKINHCQLQIEKTVLYKKGLLQKMFC